MKRALLFVWALTAACGGDGPLTAAQVARRLAAMPGVTVEEKATRNFDYHYFVVHFTQPIDHDNPAAGTFQQEVSLLHRDTGSDVPMIVYTTGYSDYTLDTRAELTTLFAANQVSIEHRYFGESRPASPDWQQLTIKQAAADEHAIIEALRQVYDGAFITTGASKGGMTAVFHRRFYPDDVEGTVPYVAPISFGAPDARYNPFVDMLGPTDCHAAVQAAATEMLKPARRAQLVASARALQGATYTRVSAEAAVEESVYALEWQFWQYVGVSGCASVPTPAADDAALFAFLQKASPVNNDSDYAFFEAYVYQAYAQLGYPATHTDYLGPPTFPDEAYAGELPTPRPAFDGAAMQDIASFVKTSGDRLLFVYGGWDPWTGGKFDLGAATDSAIYIQDQGTHGAKIARLATADRDAAIAKVEAWTGATADLARLSPMSSTIEPPRLRRLMAR